MKIGYVRVSKAERYRTELQQISAPQAPDLHLIFNPEGLSNRAVEKNGRV